MKFIDREQGRKSKIFKRSTEHASSLSVPPPSERIGNNTSLRQKKRSFGNGPLPKNRSKED